MTKIPKIDAAIMPPNTGVPTAWRVAAPAPCAITSGKSPRMNAKLVIITGRNLRPAASMAAGFDVFPQRRCSTANATIRMPFLAASAINATSPICA